MGSSPPSRKPPPLWDPSSRATFGNAALFKTWHRSPFAALQWVYWCHDEVQYQSQRSESNFNWQGEAPQWCLSTHDYYSWLVVDLPLWNMMESQWGLWLPNIWKNVPNHQPVTIGYKWILKVYHGISPQFIPRSHPFQGGCHRMFFPMKCVISPKKKWGYPMGSTLWWTNIAMENGHL